MNSVTQSFRLSIVLIATIYYHQAFALTNGVDVYENIDDCDEGFTGPQCDMPYEICDDGKRKCFNNSKCVRNNKRDAVSGEYEYGCDCSYSEGVSAFAGFECEHSSQKFCDATKFDKGSTFCANEGQCEYIKMDGHRYAACKCPSEFAGAHCQYLHADIDGKGLIDETSIPGMTNTFTYSIPDEEKSNKRAVAMGITFSVVIVLVSAIAFYALRRRGKRGQDNDEVPSSFEMKSSNGVDDEEGDII